MQLEVDKKEGGRQSEEEEYGPQTALKSETYYFGQLFDRHLPHVLLKVLNVYVLYKVWVNL